MLVLLSWFFFFHVPPKEKDDPDNGNERIPAVGSDQLTLTSVPDQPHIKYKTDTHAYCIWMLILLLEILNFFWQGISRGLSFMYVLKFMKFQHIKVDTGTDFEKTKKFFLYFLNKQENTFATELS